MIVLTLVYIVYLIVVVAKQKGYLNKTNARVFAYYYWSFAIIACILGVLTDFVGTIHCDM